MATIAVSRSRRVAIAKSCGIRPPDIFLGGDVGFCSARSSIWKMLALAEFGTVYATLTAGTPVNR